MTIREWGRVRPDSIARQGTMKGHPTANRCYAWSEPVSGSEGRRFFAVVHEGPVTNAKLALRASIVKDVRESKAPPWPGSGDVRD